MHLNGTAFSTLVQGMRILPHFGPHVSLCKQGALLRGANVLRPVHLVFHLMKLKLKSRSFRIIPRITLVLREILDTVVTDCVSGERGWACTA